jgi:hypothetical protein
MVIMGKESFVVFIKVLPRFLLKWLGKVTETSDRTTGSHTKIGNQKLCFCDVEMKAVTLRCLKPSFVLHASLYLSELFEMKLPHEDISSSPSCCPVRFFFFFQRKCYGALSKSFRTGRLQIVQLSATRCSSISILWVNLVSFAAINLCVVSQLVFIVIVVYFVIESVRKLLDTPS